MIADEEWHRHAAENLRRADALLFFGGGTCRSLAPTVGRFVTYLLAAHESSHTGQLMQSRGVKEMEMLLRDSGNDSGG